MILSSSVETITPEIARRYLETSAGNRHVRPTNVAALAGAMRRGQYRAMALADYNAMSDVAQSLHRALARGILSSKNKMDAVARGLSVFDKRKSSNSKIQVKDGRLEDVRREIIEFSKLTKVQPF